MYSSSGGAFCGAQGMKVFPAVLHERRCSLVYSSCGGNFCGARGVKVFPAVLEVRRCSLRCPRCECDPAVRDV